MTDYTQAAANVATDIQSGGVARLRACPVFNGIYATYERVGNIAAEIDLALGTLRTGFSLGICVALLTPLADDLSKSPGPVFDPFRLVVAVYENVLLNEDTANGGSGKPAIDVAINAYRLFKGWQPPHCNSPLQGIPGTLQQVPNKDGLLIYHVRMACKLALLPLRLTGEASYVRSV